MKPGGRYLLLIDANPKGMWDQRQPVNFDSKINALNTITYYITLQIDHMVAPYA